MSQRGAGRGQRGQGQRGSGGRGAGRGRGGQQHDENVRPGGGQPHHGQHGQQGGRGQQHPPGYSQQPFHGAPAQAPPHQVLAAAPPPAQSAWGRPAPQAQPPQEVQVAPPQYQQPPPQAAPEPPQQAAPVSAPVASPPPGFPPAGEPQGKGGRKKRAKGGKGAQASADAPAQQEQQVQSQPAQQQAAVPVISPPQTPTSPPPDFPPGSQPQGQVQGDKKKKGGKGGQQQPASQTGPRETTPVSTGGGDDITKKMGQVHLSAGGGGDTIKSVMKASGGGTAGSKVKVYVNHYAMDMGKLKTVYQYDVVMDPDKPKRQLRIVMNEFCRRHFPGLNPAYDGAKILYSAKPLPFKGELEGKIKVVCDERDKEYTIKLKLVQQIDMTEVAKFYEQLRQHRLNDVPQTCLQVVDVVLRHSLTLRQIAVGSSLFSVPLARDRTIDLGNGMHLYQGIYQSAILGWKPFLNVDVANKAFPSAVNVIDLIKTMLAPPAWERNPRPADLTRELGYDTIEKLKKHLRTLKLVSEVPRNPASRRIYRVNDVVSTAARYEFTLDNGQKTNVVNYYKQHKGYQLQYPNMPVLWVGSRNNKIHVPVEICTIMPGQPVNRKCDADQTSKMIKECARDTNYRKGVIEHNVAHNRYNEDPVVKEFGFRISNELEIVDARILAPPEIRYSNRTTRVNRGVWNSEKFMQPGRIAVGWTILNLERNIRPQEIQNLVDLAKTNGNQLGLDMSRCLPAVNIVLAPRDPPQRILQEKFEMAKKAKIDLVVVILPTRDANVYNHVKKASEIAVGCLTQCIKAFTVQRKMSEMTMKNILLKVNAKLNGSNHHIQTLPTIMKASYVMLMGADVTHPSPDVVDGFSVAAVTASHCPNAFKYNICWRLQQPGQEIIVDMLEIAREQLMFFYKSNKGMKPEKIIFFRDGVSTGQFDDVLRSELQAIRNACSRLEPGYKPPITFVVVQKRHHTRFFPVDTKISQDRNLNVPAGTVVDQVITHPTRQDFYLVSHASIQGVAKPTKYVTLWDDNDMSDDQLEQLTYYLCHMFARCTRSVSYPAPTYYAHLAAARGKVYCDASGINTGQLAREQQALTIKDCIVKEMPMFFV